MAPTHVRAKVSRPDRKGRALSVRFLVDTGAVYTVLPGRACGALKLKPERKVEFTLADGTTIGRGVSECRFTVGTDSVTSPVVLGAPEDAALLGAVTLETLGLMINPLSREPLPMRLVLAANRASPTSVPARPPAQVEGPGLTSQTIALAARPVSGERSQETRAAPSRPARSAQA